MALRCRQRRRTRANSFFMLTVFGVFGLTFMMVMYALEPRGKIYTLGFAAGCLLASAYGFLGSAWPFGVVEAIWCVVALRRYVTPAGP